MKTIHRSSWFAFALSAVLVAFLFWGALAAERDNTRLDFEQTSVNRIHALRTEVQSSFELLQLGSHHLELTHGGNLQGFRHYTETMLAQHPYWQAVGFNPRVLWSERAAFEQKSRQEQQGFRITETSVPGVFQSAQERAEYFPFLYAEPAISNQLAIGFDVAMETRTDPTLPRRRAMDIALSSHSMAVTAPVTLALKKASGDIGVIAFSPLYRNGQHESEQFFGFSTLVIRVGDMLLWSQRAAIDRGLKDVRLFLQDVTGPVPVSMYGDLPELLPPLHYEETIEIPGRRQWRVIALPADNFFSLAPRSDSLFLLAVGGALSFLLGLLFQVLAGRAEAIRRQVLERTADLAAANGKMAQEVERRVESEIRLRHISALQNSVLANAGYAIIATDNEGLLQVFNPAAERILGYAAGEVVHQFRPSVFHEQGQVPDEDGSRFRAIVARLDHLSPGTSYEQEVTYWNKAGNKVPVKLALSAMLDDAGVQVGYMGIAHDISSQKADQARITRLAHYDTLTDLPNRLQLGKALRHSIATARRSGQQLGVLFVDLDRFKNVNDSLGHLVGDKLLKIMADRLQVCVREGDMVARMGGDEFVILLNALARPQDAAEVADRILTQVSAPTPVDNHVLTVTPSIGIALYPEDGGDSDALIQNADTAMYSSKEHGRNRYRFFTRSMNERVSSRLEMESQIRRGLEESRFILHYQPQIDAVTGQLIGAEALVRMRGDKGLVPPDQFIPVAEDSGLILPLGDWVLMEAARCNRAWLDAGLNAVPIAVNVSARQFEQPDFPDRVRATLLRTGLEPEWLHIELTESTIMQSVDKTLEALVALKALGLRIVIDDFGTGFSSLAYLKRFPIDCLKIDRSFVEDLRPGTDDNFIVKAIIGLAHQLDLEIVAEGVETEMQADLLRAWGCSTFQGYLLGRPMDEASFERLIRD
jgi:diguanylate cyclase (GGDEF)-like protein/PAS domain S-box-containing protein